MLHFAKKGLSTIAVAALLFIAAVSLEFLNPHTIHQPKGVTVWVFDVGQGDSIFIQGPMKQVLIDGGENRLVLERLEEVLPFWDRHIDYIVNTHPHADHVSGLVHVLDHYMAGEVLTSGQRYSTAVYEYFTNEVDERVIYAGEVIDLGAGATLTFIWPTESLEGVRLNDPNAGSLVALLEYEGRSMLLTGDIGVEEEEALVEQLGDIDVLKVGHQGSNTSTSASFLERTQPEYSIISVGENSYGHPHPIVVDRLQQAGSDVFRTDDDGSVKVEFIDGNVFVGGYRLGL